MNFEFMTIDTPLPPCMPFPRTLTRFPVSSTAKVMYCRMLDAMISKGQEDENGILFVCLPIIAIAEALSRSPMTVKRSLNELETAGLIMRVRQGIGEPNRIYVLIPEKEDSAVV
jgi:DNA-binding MarR family transcriptional regulator